MFKKLIPLIFLMCLIGFGIFSSYKKKVERFPHIFNEPKTQTYEKNSFYIN